MARSCIAGFAMMMALLAPASSHAFSQDAPSVTSHRVTAADARFVGGYQQQPPLPDGTPGPRAILDPPACESRCPPVGPLPVHHGALVSIRTPAARNVTARISSATRAHRVRIDRVGETGTVWTFRMPPARRDRALSIGIEYEDGFAAWSLPVRSHRHRVR